MSSGYIPAKDELGPDEIVEALSSSGRAACSGKGRARQGGQEGIRDEGARSRGA